MNVSMRRVLAITVILFAGFPSADSSAHDESGIFVDEMATHFPPAINLSDLDGSNGFVINGIDENDRSGWSVSAAGDVNGNGIDDVIIGATFADPNGVRLAGESYVVFGHTTGFPAAINLSDLDGSNGFVINGIDELDRSGFSVSAAGDVNGDGIDDVIIGTPFAAGNAGASYVVFGHTTGFPAAINLSDLDGSNGFVINGIDEGDESGWSVSAAGDVNGDGIDDVIIGAFAFSGSMNGVVFGRTTGFPATINLSDLDGSNGFVIIVTEGFGLLGLSVSGAGDVNGDGIDDVIIGAPGDELDVGGSYVVFGHAAGFPSTINLSDLDGSNGFVINGIDPEDFTGASVSGAGDVNGDGIDDVIIGAPDANPVDGINDAGESAGESYVVFGRTTGFPAAINLSDLNGSNGFVIYGIERFGFLGFSVSAAGDVNRDGIDDVIISAPGVGMSGVVFGRTTGFPATINLSDLDGSNGFVIIGDQRGASDAGDVNGDGIDDVIIGGNEKSYVVFGRGDVVPINIDIKPGNNHNIINPSSKGGIWVAVLSDTDPESLFDPLSQVDIPTVEFGPDGAKAIHHKVKDINKDGLGDLLLRFKIPETGIACGDTEAMLTGERFDGQSFSGTDSIKSVGCKKPKKAKKKHKGK